MDKSNQEPKHTPDKKKAKRVAKYQRARHKITREQFHALVKKAAQPVKDTKDTNESDATSEET